MCGFQWKVMFVDLNGILCVDLYVKLYGLIYMDNYLRGFMQKIVCVDFYGNFHVWIYMAIYVGISMDDYLCGFQWEIFYVASM